MVKVKDGLSGLFEDVIYKSSCCERKLEWLETLGDAESAHYSACCEECSRRWIMIPRTVQVHERSPGVSQLVKAVIVGPPAEA